MTTPNHPTIPALAELLDGLGDHLAAHPGLPAPSGVDLDVWDRRVKLHLFGHSTRAELARVLLAWARTLTDLDADVYRAPDPHVVHVRLHGQAADGTAFVVWAVLACQVADWPDLPEKITQRLALDMLHTWATHTGNDTGTDAGVAA